MISSHPSLGFNGTPVRNADSSRLIRAIDRPRTWVEIKSNGLLLNFQSVYPRRLEKVSLTRKPRSWKSAGLSQEQLAVPTPPTLALFGDCGGVARGTSLCNFLALVFFFFFSPSLALSQHPPSSPGLCAGHVGGKLVPGMSRTPREHWPKCWVGKGVAL